MSTASVQFHTNNKLYIDQNNKLTVYFFYYIKHFKMKRLPYKRLGKFIKRARMKKNLLSKDVSFALGLDPSYFSNIETGREALPWSLIKPLAHLLDINYFDLYFYNLSSKRTAPHSISAIMKTVSDPLELEDLIKEYSNDSDEIKIRFVQAASAALGSKKDTVPVAIKADQNRPFFGIFSKLAELYKSSYSR